ncbi:MAG TPA: hypothetical protein VGP04_02000 [Pseudonocardiaceae bacterium]|nr:hypothetical protein [Pseudonocardiaceae bacterium]
MERNEGIGPRSRLTDRPRRSLGAAVARSNRAVSDVAAEYGVTWHIAHRALVTAAARWLPEPVPTPVLGLDGTRARSVRWPPRPAGWTRSDPWLTSFVDADPARRGPLPGPGPGPVRGVRAGVAGRADRGFPRRGPRGGHRSVRAVCRRDPRRAAAHADRRRPLHLVRLANDMLTEVRQRVATPPPGW